MPIKLDQSFFRGKNDTRRGRYIVESILRLAAQLHIRTVAEGIDELRQVEYLRQAACDMIQGFYFFKPMPVEEFEAAAYEDKHLKTLTPQQQKADGQTGQDLSAAMDPSTEKNIVLFSYFLDEDKVVFSAPFSPILKIRLPSRMLRHCSGRRISFIKMTVRISSGQWSGAAGNMSGWKVPCAFT